MLDELSAPRHAGAIVPPRVGLSADTDSRATAPRPTAGAVGVRAATRHS